MRVKNVKKALAKVKSSPLILNEVKIIKGDNIILEIGAGKGDFIINHALENKDAIFVAVEKYSSVILRILEKQEELNLDNLILLNEDANTLLNFFSNNSIDIIYLNFSDPWPKARHHKKRLTYPSFLKLYKQLLKKDGKIVFRTDHLELFNDSVLYLKEEGFKVSNIDHDSKPISIMSEYEVLKRNSGIKINSLTAFVEA